MAKPLFEILDSVDTAIGTLMLRRRELLGRAGMIVTEVTIDHEMLMSSLNTISECALSTAALAFHPEGKGLRVLVGGLGLGYTAHAALEDERVELVRVVDRLPVVMGWLRAGHFPLSEQLNGDARLELVESDVYADLLGPAEETYDLILIDVDHTPTELLDAASAPFYTPQGQERVKEHLAPGGVLAVWSAGDNDDFAAVLRHVYPESKRELVVWNNELINDGQEIEDVVFLARRDA
jgi:spermidine synthase